MPVQTDRRERAEHHAHEAERLLKSWWLSSHVQAQVHATLAVYYSVSEPDDHTGGRSSGDP